MIVVIAYALAVYFFVPRGSEIDELGLFNPVYMKLMYGRMTYPIYGHFQSMYVHPPVRYAEVAALMRAGFSLPYAEGFMPCFLMIGIAFAIAQGKFSLGSKLSLLFGCFAALVWLSSIDESLMTLRPDRQLALAWFLGLVLLQDGFLREWSLPRLFLGSFAITYASGLHYFAVMAFIGVGYYAIMAFRQLAGKRLQRVLMAIVAGGCAFGIPYIVLFALPDWRNILRFSGEVQAAGNWLAPVVRHFAQYEYWKMLVLPFQAGVLPVFSILYLGTYLKLPLFLVGSALLAFKRDLRGLAVASLPLTVFVFAYSQGKSASYFLPELIIYFCGIGVVVWLAIDKVTARLAPRFAQATAALLFVTGACWATQAGYPFYGQYLSSSGPLIAPMEIMRACAKRLVGGDAFIGGRIGLWYISGAQSWYDISPDLLWKNDMSDISLPEYLSKFDYIVEHNHMSYTTINSSKESLPSWYASGLLKLHAFVVNEQHQVMDFLIFKTSARSALTGYIVDEHKVLRFDENSEGAFVFVSRLCQFESWPPVNRLNLPHFNAIYLPRTIPGGPPATEAPSPSAAEPQSAVVTSVMPEADFTAIQTTMDGKCRVLDTVRGSLKEIGVAELLASRDREPPMQFRQSIEDVQARKFDDRTVSLPGFNLDHMVAAFAKATIDTRSQVKVVTTARERYSFAASIEMPDFPVPEPAWVAVRLRIIQGQFGIGILDKDKNDFSSRTFFDVGHGSETVYIRLRPTPGPKALIIENGENIGASVAEIESVRVISGAHEGTLVGQ